MFENRTRAGELLALKLSLYKGGGFLLVAIPRGGVVIAKVISNALCIPMTFVLTRKIGAPEQRELAIGAISSGGIIVREDKLICDLSVSEKYIKKEINKEKKAIAERMKKYGNSTVYFKDKQTILIDDGIATGATTKAAIAYLRKEKVNRIILAVPVAPKDTLKELNSLVDKIIVLNTPNSFSSVGQFYKHFPQITDEEVVELLST